MSVESDSHMSKITFPIRPSNEEGSCQGFIRDDKTGTVFIGEGSWGAYPRKNDDDKLWTLRSGSFNQIKWIQVFPETTGKEADMDIRTVITSTVIDRKVTAEHVNHVADLNETDVFAIPENIKLFTTEPYGSVIRVPFKMMEEKGPAR